ncbi:MAG: hypothetical protein LJE93_12545 [Acidobacteria bacterium]|jgi:hypothetical protein|nr:hypothetical protein [Acidobacteriota bacterium]
MRLPLGRLFVLGMLGAIAAGCGTTTPAMPNPITEPVIDMPGENIVRYRDSVIEVVLETKFAAANLGEEWLILNAAMSGMTGGSTEVKRALISVRSPDGRTIPMPSYREFNAAYKDLAPIARRASLASDPLSFTRGGRRGCRIDFFPLPGSGRSARTSLNVSKNDLCAGMLYFPIRDGVQPGRWKLAIEFEETEAVVPFVLENR